jgi:hypothetical protein
MNKKMDFNCLTFLKIELDFEFDFNILIAYLDLIFTRLNDTFQQIFKLNVLASIMKLKI